MSKDLQHATNFIKAVEAFEGHIKNTPADVAGQLETNHYLAHGVYARELLIPAGCKLVGAIHRHSCINIISKGTITITTEEGERLVKAPCVVVSAPGTKRYGFAHTDTIWITVHHTEQIDPDLIEQEVIAKDFYELEHGSAPEFEPAGLNSTEERTLQMLLAKQTNGNVLPSPTGKGNEENEEKGKPCKGR